MTSPIDISTISSHQKWCALCFVQLNTYFWWCHCRRQHKKELEEGWYSVVVATPSPWHGYKDETKEAPLCLGYIFSKAGFATGTRSETYQLQRQNSQLLPFCEAVNSLFFLYKYHKQCFFSLSKISKWYVFQHGDTTRLEDSYADTVENDTVLY